MRSTLLLGTAMVVLALIQGCVAGYNSAFLATNSNLGFNYDTAPPSLEIDISRYEGVVEPTFEGGQTVPVLASLYSGSGAFRNFFWGVKSTFSTGQAAYTMSHLFADDTPDNLPDYEKVTLSKMPAPKLFGVTVKYIEPGEVKPVVFGTDTVLGIKIKWSGQTGQFPSSANIGFKRKEGTLAPIGVKQVSKPDPYDSKKTIQVYEADVASLLATLDTDVATPSTTTSTTTTPSTTTSSTTSPNTTTSTTTTSGTTTSSTTASTITTSGTTATLTSPGVTLNYVQYFATGCAANELARRKDVRVAMLKKTDPSIDMHKAVADAQAKKAEAGKAQWELNQELINDITEIFNNPSTSDENKTKILAKAQGLTLVGQNVTKSNFVQNLKRHVGDASKTANLKELKVYAGNPK